MVLPAARERGNRRYWIVDAKHDAAFLISLSPTEAVIAVATRDVLERRLALILGDELPPQPLTTARFRELAKRDGFSGVGVGFVDLARVAALATETESPACKAAAAAIASRLPRIGFGYDELSAKRMSFGIVVELAPDVLAQARTLSTTLAGIDRLLHTPSVFAIALAADVDKAKALAPRAAAAIRSLEECSPSFEELAKPLDALATLAIPSYVAGTHGMLAAMTAIHPGTSTLDRFDGYAVVHLASAEAILQQLAHNLPGFEAPDPDGKAKPIAFIGHIAARADTIAVAHGTHSETAVEEVLADPPATAPLAVLRWDYSRLPEVAELFPNEKTDLEVIRGLSRTLGMTTFQVDLDDRGLVGWFAMELR